MSEFDYIPSTIVAAEFEATPHFTEGNEEPTIFYECVALLTQVAREWTEHELSIPAAPEALYKRIRPAKGFMHLLQQVGPTWRNEITGPSLDDIAAKGSFWQVGLSGDRIHARYHREQWDSLPEDITAGWRPTLHDLAQKLWPDLAPSQEEPAPAGWSLDPQDWPNCCPFHGEYQSSLAAHAMPCGSVLWGQGFTVDVEGSRFTIWGECVEDNSDSDDDCYEEVCHACGEDKDDDEIHMCNDCDKMFHSQCDEYEMMQYAEDDNDDGVTLCSACVDKRVEEREGEALDRALRSRSSRLKPLPHDHHSLCNAYLSERRNAASSRQCKEPAHLMFHAEHRQISHNGEWSFQAQREHPVCRSCAEKVIDEQALAQSESAGLHPMFVRPAPMLDSEKVYWSAHAVKPAWKKTVTERYYNYGTNSFDRGKSGWEEHKTVFADFLDGRGIVMLCGPSSARFWRPCKDATYNYDQGDLKVFFYGHFSRQWKIAKGPRAKVEEHYTEGCSWAKAESSCEMVDIWDWTQEPEGYAARSWS